MKVDLHAHSNASDGLLSPEQLVSTAFERGVRVFSITDHDSVESVPRAIEAARNTDITLIPGVELSAVHDGLDVHVLGYFVDIANGPFLERLASLREARLQRARVMVDELQKAGLELTLDQVLLLAEEGSVGRSHVARALVDQGHADSVRDAFERLIGRGRPFYVPKETATPADAVATITDAGGVAVLAHPAITGVESLIPVLAREGLAGVEAFHAEQTKEQCLSLERAARALGLLVTGGSDYHGPTSPGGELGETELDEKDVEALLASGQQ